jgi:hypothetical protein
MLNTPIWPNEPNSSESPGFPGLSAGFFPNALILKALWSRGSGDGAFNVCFPPI